MKFSLFHVSGASVGVQKLKFSRPRLAVRLAPPFTLLGGDRKSGVATGTPA